MASGITAERSGAGCIIRSLDGYPDLLDLHDRQPLRYPHLLESVAHGGQQARFDILFAFPDAALVLDADGTLSVEEPVDGGSGFLDSFDAWWSRLQVPREPGADALVPFRGGWFVYLGYELAAEIEPLLDLPRSREALPGALAVRCPAAIIRDHQRHCVHLVAETGRGALLDILNRDVELAGPAAGGPAWGPAVEIREQEPERYVDSVRRVKRYIVEGDVFQVNLSRRWDARLAYPADPGALYRRLRESNPAPFAGLSRWRESAIVSSSPERLVRVQGDRIQTRPIAGTRPRGGADAADRAYSRELLAHPKERAEHIMLIDLERNDLGRVCRPGSIEVNELMVIESYAHVHHIVSNVRGRLRSGTTPGQVIRAVFPGGTITGCPKVRCMEIIAELEQEGRGAYTGSMGYINRDGDLDLNILIRTLVQEDGAISLRAGAGIVADSVAERELDETRAKARGLLLALAASER